MSGLLFIVGGVLVLLGAGAGIILPSAPSSIQTNQFLKPIGSLLISKGNEIALIGLLAIIFAVFIGRKS